jgi:hypothetical protein
VKQNSYRKKSHSFKGFTLSQIIEQALSCECAHGGASGTLLLSRVVRGCSYSSCDHHETFYLESHGPEQTALACGLGESVRQGITAYSRVSQSVVCGPPESELIGKGANSDTV